MIFAGKVSRDFPCNVMALKVSKFVTFGCFRRLSSNVGSFMKQVPAIFVVNRPLSSFCSRGSSWQRESRVIYRVVLRCIGRKQTTFLYVFKGRTQLTMRTSCCTVNANP